MEAREDALLGHEAVNLRERRPERPVLSKKARGDVLVSKEPASDAAAEGLVKRAQHLRRMVKGKSRQQDAGLRTAEEVCQHHGGVSSPALAGLGPRPDELRGTCAFTPLSERDAERLERTLAAQSIEGLRLLHELLESLGLHREPRQGKRNTLSGHGCLKPLEHRGGDAA